MATTHYINGCRAYDLVIVSSRFGTFTDRFWSRCLSDAIAAAMKKWHPVITPTVKG